MVGSEAGYTAVAAGEASSGDALLATTDALDILLCSPGQGHAASIMALVALEVALKKAGLSAQAADDQLADQIRELVSPGEMSERDAPEAVALWRLALAHQWNPLKRDQMDTVLRVVGALRNGSSKIHRAPSSSMRRLLWISAVAIVVGLLALALGPKIVRIGNLAYQAKVTASSSHAKLGLDPQRLVDGDRSAFGVFTASESDPWALLDLGAPHRLREVIVYNRVDCCQDRIVPLVVETSLDGKTFSKLASRKHKFETWAMPGARREARFVRIRSERTAELVLTEVEVY